MSPAKGLCSQWRKSLDRKQLGLDLRNAPSGIRTRATTLKGWRPRPLVDGGGPARIAANGVYTGHAGPVAQLVEQGTFNPKVTGSIPVRPIRPRMAARIAR